MSRNTHDRLHDHHAVDLDTNVVLDGDVGATASGATVHAALLALAGGGAGGLDTDVLLDGDVGAIASGSTVHQALLDLLAAIGAGMPAATRWEILVDSSTPDLIWDGGDLIHVEVPL